MIKKINKEASLEAWASGCGTPKETSNNDEEVQLDQLRKEVSNYRTVMTRDFKVPDDKILTMVPINVKHLQSLLDKNTGLSAARMYLIKKTDKSEEDDFEVLFVPCREKVEEGKPDNSFFEDMLDGESSIISVKCRRPPGCAKGAVLL